LEWLNYHHLFYFWTVVREGSVTAACRRLKLAQPTISGQLRTLEKAFGQPLFARSGRRIVPTDFGKMVASYAEEIFTTGQELMDAVRHGRLDRPMRFVVGVADVVPKLVSWSVLEPVLHMEREVQLVAQEGKPDQLMAALALHDIDLVISDRPLARDVRVKAYNHVLGSSPVAFFAPSASASRYRKAFPKSLDGAPMLLPTANTAVRTALDQWLEREGLRPLVVAEFEDSALMKVFGQAGHGIFLAPEIMAAEVERKYRCRRIGMVPELTEEFFAISLERRVTHPAVLAICEVSRNTLFR
jgi:LysR family transcriptional activator of nhaA